MIIIIGIDVVVAADTTSASYIFLFRINVIKHLNQHHHHEGHSFRRRRYLKSRVNYVV